MSVLMCWTPSLPQLVTRLAPSAVAATAWNGVSGSPRDDRHGGVPRRLARGVLVVAEALRPAGVAVHERHPRLVGRRARRPRAAARCSLVGRPHSTRTPARRSRGTAPHARATRSPSWRSVDVDQADPRPLAHDLGRQVERRHPRPGGTGRPSCRAGRRSSRPERGDRPLGRAGQRAADRHPVQSARRSTSCGRGRSAPARVRVLRVAGEERDGGEVHPRARYGCRAAVNWSGPGITADRSGTTSMPRRPVPTDGRRGGCRSGPPRGAAGHSLASLDVPAPCRHRLPRSLGAPRTRIRRRSRASPRPRWSRRSPATVGARPGAEASPPTLVRRSPDRHETTRPTPPRRSPGWP